MNRRELLEALGAVGMLAAASEDGAANVTQEDARQCRFPECIHPVLGYPGVGTDAEVPDGLEPDHEVELSVEEREDRPLPEFFFEPTGLAVEPGDVVRFSFGTPDHTVTAYHPALGRQRRVPEGVSPFSSPVLGLEDFWLYRFDEPGVYDLLCSPHEVFGMVMRVVAGEPETDFGEPGPGQRPPAFTAEPVLEDPALAPENVEEVGQVSWDDLAPESKELLLVPAEEGGDGDGGAADGDGETVEVLVGPDQRLVFEPETVEVAIGDTVRWEFVGEGHNVSARPGASEKVRLPEGAEPFASYEGDRHYTLNQVGETYEHTFEVPGEYVYVCTPHADQGMVGEVIVEETRE